jgi:hypothetical protein
MSVPIIGGAKRLVFVSVATYELGKQLGVEGAAREFLRQCEKPTRSDLPAARMVARLRTLADVGLYHAFGSNLSKLRSRSAHAAIESGAQFWLMLDDDVECDQSTLLRMLATAGEPDAERAVILPCLLRGTAEDRHTVNVKWESSLIMASTGGTCRPVEHGGTGAMLVTRGALQRVAHFCNDTARMCPWRDDDGVIKIPMFHQMFEMNEPNGKEELSYSWFGEDLSFCRRLRAAGVELLGLTSGWSVHDGQKLELDTLR